MQQRWSGGAHTFGKSFVISKPSVELGLVIEVEGKSRMNLGQGKIVFGANFVDASAHALVPNRDVGDRYAPTGNMRLPAKHPGGGNDVAIEGQGAHFGDPLIRLRLLNVTA